MRAVALVDNEESFLFAMLLLERVAVINGQDISSLGKGLLSVTLADLLVLSVFSGSQSFRMVVPAHF